MLLEQFRRELAMKVPERAASRSKNIPQFPKIDFLVGSSLERIFPQDGTELGA